MSASSANLTDRSSRPTVLTLAGVEARKMVDTRAGFWLLALTALAAVGGTLGQSLGSKAASAQAVDVFFTAASAVGVLLPIVGILLVTSEWSQRTGLITFTLVPARGRIVAAKLMASIAVAVSAGLICLALGLLGGSALGAGSELDVAEAGRGLLFLAISVLSGVSLGLAFENSPVAIVFYFAGPILVGAVGAISSSIGDITRWIDQSGLITLVEMDRSGVEWDRVAVTALVWVALPLAVGMIRLRRGDID